MKIETDILGGLWLSKGFLAFVKCWLVKRSSRFSSLMVALGKIASWIWIPKVSIARWFLCEFTPIGHVITFRETKS